MDKVSNVTIVAVIPSYNRLQLLSSAVESVLNQSVSIASLIVIDDCSSFSKEDFFTKIKKFPCENHEVIFFRKTSNSGACNSRNLGVNISHGDYIAFLDDDDVWEPDHIEKLLTALTEHDAVLAYSGKKITQFSTGKYRKSLNVIPQEDQFEHLLRCNYPGSTSSIMVKREAFIAAGGFDEALPAIQDYDFYLRLAKYGKIVTSGAHTLKYRADTPVKITNQLDKARRAYFEILDKYDGHQQRVLARTILVQNIKKAILNFKLDYLGRFLFDYLKVGLGSRK